MMRTGRGRVAPLAGVLLMVLLAGCQAPAERNVSISHVHGLAYDPGAGALYVATHHGVARGTSDGDAWDWEYVGEDRHDYMGFTQDAIASGTFYSSGHPANPREFGGVHLGLRRSTDGARTWEQRSLQGDVDFHALTGLTSGEGHLAGFYGGTLKVSRDAGATWQDHPQPIVIYALARSDGHLWAGTPSGLKRTSDYSTWSDVGHLGAVGSVAAARDGQLLVVWTGHDRGGAAQRSLDGGATWEPLSNAPLRDAPAPVVFAMDPANASHLFASTASATILESRDKGATWETIRQG